MKWVTAPLNATAYVRINQTLTHRALIDDNGQVIRTGCKVLPQSILDDATQYTQETPTCLKCATLTTERSMWQTKTFRSESEARTWMERNTYRYQCVLIWIHNGCAVEYRKLRSA